MQFASVYAVYKAKHRVCLVCVLFFIALALFGQGQPWELASRCAKFLHGFGPRMVCEDFGQAGDLGTSRHHPAKAASASFSKTSVVMTGAMIHSSYATKSLIYLVCVDQLVMPITPHHVIRLSSLLMTIDQVYGLM